MAAARAGCLHSRRTDPRHRCRRQGRNLRPRPPVGRARHRRPHHLVRGRGTARRLRPGADHGPWRDRRRIHLAGSRSRRDPARRHAKARGSRVMQTTSTRASLAILRSAPALLFVAVVVLFAILAPRFLEVQNFANILTQSANVAIVAVGMTFVLLLAGVDLSVGAAMYVCAAVAGLYFKDLPAPAAMALMTAIGALFGAINALFIVGLGIAAFVVTLATLFVGRGLALHLSQTKMVFAGDPVLTFGQGGFLGISYAVWTMAAVLLVALWVQQWTPYGRYLYAIGADRDGARKAGIPVRRVVFATYVLCGALAGLGGFVSFSQVAAASSGFGLQKEFPVIAAAVLGGTSLFGGRGGVLGSVFGAILIQTVQNGLVLLNANPYLYPLVISAIIFIAVLLDSQRTRILARLTRRQIRIEPGIEARRSTAT
ncbi:sugar ABC transporter permease [Kaistia algarum]|nr:sugar ABC transporter permease [Kaistia algarum]